MKWFKHYSNAHTNKFIQAMLNVKKTGLEDTMRYWLLVELLCGEFKKDTIIFTLSFKQLKGALYISQDQKLRSFMELLRNFSATFDQELLKITEIPGEFFEIKTPIISELIGKEFKRTRQRSVSYAAKNKEKRIKNKKINCRVDIDASLHDDKPDDFLLRVVNYLNEKLGSKYKTSSSSTKRFVQARRNDGFTFEDFVAVIDKKFDQWGNNPEMQQYLRPQTLFGTKFESYLNEKGNVNEYKYEKLF